MSSPLRAAGVLGGARLHSSRLLEWRQHYLSYRHWPTTPCASTTFVNVELTTLFGTWWAIIGFWIGPLYIVHNLVEYIVAVLRFVRSEKYVRKGMLRLCVAAGITWIGWLGYKSLHALTSGSDGLSSIVWLILISSTGGPILIAWVVAGFQKSAVGSE